MKKILPNQRRRDLWPAKGTGGVEFMHLFMNIWWFPRMIKIGGSRGSGAGNNHVRRKSFQTREEDFSGREEEISGEQRERLGLNQSGRLLDLDIPERHYPENCLIYKNWLYSSWRVTLIIMIGFPRTKKILPNQRRRDLWPAKGTRGDERSLNLPSTVR
jgi:hypothetical protein